jgi:DNA replication protein DnaC
MTLEETLSKLHAMKLHTMADSLRERLARHDHANLAFEEMLSLLVDDEWLSRENRKLAKRLARARFKKQATMEDVNYQFKRGLVKAKMLDLTTLSWIAHHRDLVFIGPTGIGKSYLAQALGHHACMKGHTVHYLRVSTLLGEFGTAHADGSFVHLLARLVKCDVLILDDWGIGVLKAQERRDLLDLIEERSEIRSTIITTQLPRDHWHDFIGDETIADAICDRIIHRACVIELDGPSMRKEAKDKEA